MAAKRPFPLYLIISVFLVTAGMLPLSRQVLRQPPPPPRTVTELTVLLSQNTPSLHVISVMEDQPEGGIYICMQRQAREQLFTLPRDGDIARKGKWKGVVYCENYSNHLGVIEEHITQSWREYGMRIGQLLFFGDPVLLRRIHSLILGSQG